MVPWIAGLPRCVLAALGLFLFLAAAPVHAGEAGSSKPQDGLFLQGQLLIASPQIGDPRFARTVIYMVDHNKKGALGLVVNKVFGSGSMEKFLRGFNIDVGEIEGDIRLHYGGPVEPGAGFVLHTADYQGPGTRVVNSEMALTTEMSVLKAIAEGHGPRHSLFALGYAGWGAGQLEGEIARGDWFSAPADENLIFDEDVETKWERAQSSAGLKL
ncbi:MAG: YqgE/AlgH family protein [Rhodospirillales bacterium]